MNGGTLETLARRTRAHTIQASRSAMVAAASDLAAAMAIEHALSPREQHVLALWLLGHGTASCARALAIKPRTVKFHAGHIIEKLGVTRMAEAVRLATGSQGRKCDG